jgi:hypothetical protein
MLNLIMAGPGVATPAMAPTIYEDGAEDTASNLHSYQEAASVGGLFQLRVAPFECPKFRCDRHRRRYVVSTRQGLCHGQASPSAPGGTRKR